MRRIFYLFIAVLLTVFSVDKSYSQEVDRHAKKEQRKLERLEAEKEQEAFVKQLLSEKDFTFTASEISTTGKAAFSNIRLNSLWYVAVHPNSLTCYLPIYGTASPISQPTLLRRMDFTTDDFKYELTVDEKGRKDYQLKIVASDSRSNTEYTFRFSIPANGSNVRVAVNSSFNSPVSFSGNIRN